MKPLASRQEFREALNHALETESGFAAGRLSASVVNRLNYPIICERNPALASMKVVRDDFIFNAFDQSALIPADVEFQLEFNKFYVSQMKQLDYLGVYPEIRPPTPELFDYHDLTTDCIDYHDMQPDRSTPANDAQCYLPLFEGKNILLLCPFSDLLASRANRKLFEQLWSKTGKKWFYPASVSAISFPYTYDPKTQERFGTSYEFLQYLYEKIERHTFDAALIAAAGHAIPIAAHIKRQGKIAIDLGGPLQILFGVIGKRWRSRGKWKQAYFNEHWIDMPEQYRPEFLGSDRGTYW